MRFNISLLLMIFFLVTSCGKKVKEDSPPAEIITPAITAERYLDLINDHRKDLGLDPLERAKIIEEQAYEHARAMAAGKRPFGHYGRSLRCRKIKEEFGVGNLCGESIAMGPKNAQELFDVFIETNSDRQSIEAAHYTHTGIGLEEDENGKVYWTQIFYALP